MMRFLICGALVLSVAACAGRPAERIYVSTVAPSPGYNNGQGAVVPQDNPDPRDFVDQNVPNPGPSDTVMFEADSAQLSADARATLAERARWLIANNRGVTLQGHADELATSDYNMAMGASRAGAVRDYLISQGVSAEMINIVTYGDERPAAICGDQTCAAQNRRVVVIVN